jgi:uncharacterized protein (TIRG00374 family)
MSKTLNFLIKTLLTVGLFSYLIARALQGSAFSELNVRALQLDYLALGFLFNLIATTITIIRWRTLVEALDTPLSLPNALKFGFIGFMFNLSPVGIVGGDAVKVYLLARRTRMPVERATASVVLDRVIGLYVMFILGLAVVFLTGFHHRTEPLALLATRGLVALTIATTIFMAFVVAPSSRKNMRLTIASKVPLVGGIMRKITAATLAYRHRRRVLFRAFLATFLVHFSFAISLYFLARGLFARGPSLIDHTILYCVGNVASVIPLSAGPFEYFLDELYPLFSIPGHANFEIGYGMTIGVAYRLSTVLVALVGVAYYFLSREDVAYALKAAERGKDVESNDSGNP